MVVHYVIAVSKRCTEACAAHARLLLTFRSAGAKATRDHEHKNVESKYLGDKHVASFHARHTGVTTALMSQRGNNEQMCSVRWWFRRTGREGRRVRRAGTVVLAGAIVSSRRSGWVQ
jgi:hypothetical protein